MRCMSFALESSERKEGIYSIFDLLKYNFYLPFFFFGPVMTFDQFHAQVSAPEARRKEDLSLPLRTWVERSRTPLLAAVTAQMVVSSLRSPKVCGRGLGCTRML